MCLWRPEKREGSFCLLLDCPWLNSVCVFFPQYNSDKAIVDSGTTLLRLPEKVFDAVVEAITHMSIVRYVNSGFTCEKQCFTNYIESLNLRHIKHHILLLRSKTSPLGSSLGPSWLAGWKASHRGDSSLKSQSTSEQPTLASHFASQSFHRSESCWQNRNSLYDDAFLIIFDATQY